MIPEGIRVPVIHTLPECGGIAFYSLKELVPGDEFVPEDILLLDGSHPMSGDLMVCGSCDFPIEVEDLEQDLDDIQSVKEYSNTELIEILKLEALDPQ